MSHLSTSSCVLHPVCPAVYTMHHWHVLHPVFGVHHSCTRRQTKENPADVLNACCFTHGTECMHSLVNIRSACAAESSELAYSAQFTRKFTPTALQRLNDTPATYLESSVWMHLSICDLKGRHHVGEDASAFCRRNTSVVKPAHWACHDR